MSLVCIFIIGLIESFLRFSVYCFKDSNLRAATTDNMGNISKRELAGKAVDHFGIGKYRVIDCDGSLGFLSST